MRRGASTKPEERTIIWREWLEKLTPKQLEAVQLCWVEGYTQAEAAKVLGITRQGVAKHLALARNHADMVAKWPYSCTK